jgi:hypothetical protein
MLRYVGKGFLRGVPARDLKDDEVARYGYSYLVRSGLYIPETQVTEVEPPDIVEEQPAPKRKKRKTKKEISI